MLPEKNLLILYERYMLYGRSYNERNSVIQINESVLVIVQKELGHIKRAIEVKNFAAVRSSKPTITSLQFFIYILNFASVYVLI